MEPIEHAVTEALQLSCARQRRSIPLQSLGRIRKQLKRIFPFGLIRILKQLEIQGDTGNPSNLSETYKPKWLQARISFQDDALTRRLIGDSTNNARIQIHSHRPAAPHPVRDSTLSSRVTSATNCGLASHGSRNHCGCEVRYR
jgi:hypothetical protein